MWNPLWSLFHEHIRGAWKPFVVEIDLAKIALSFHFALDFVTKKARTIQHDVSSGTIAHRPFYLMWHHCHSCGIVIFIVVGARGGVVLTCCPPTRVTPECV